MSKPDSMVPLLSKKEEVGMPRPYDDKGRFVPMSCPLIVCGNGSLQPDGGRFWRCDGLADPECAEQPLEACGFFHVDGEPYRGATND